MSVEPAGDAPMEYVGDMTFESVSDGRGNDLMSHEAWMKRAHGQYELTVVSAPIIHGTDAEVEAMVRRMIDKEGDKYKGLEPYMEMVECLASNIETSRCAMDYFTAVHCRLIIILERINGRDETEAAYREDGDAA